MQEKLRSNSEQSKLPPVSEPEPPLDLDLFLAGGPYYFSDPRLAAPPRASDRRRLERLGIPPGFLTNRGTALAADVVLEERRKRGLASLAQIRLLQAAARGGPGRIAAPNVWAMRFTEVPGELNRLLRTRLRRRSRRGDETPPG
jgi:hypothetical protein